MLFLPRTDEYPDFDSDEFWNRVYLRRFAERNAMKMARLLFEVYTGDKTKADLGAIVSDINASTPGAYQGADYL